MSVMKMAASTKRISLYVFAGIAIAIIAIAALYTSGIPLPGSTNGGSQNPITLGTLVVSIKDAPVSVTELWVTIDSVEVQSTNGWIKLPFVNEATSAHFDLLKLQDVTSTLSVVQLPSGTYTKMRLHVLDATATFENKDTADLKVPSGKIDVIAKFEIKEGVTTTVTLDMTADAVAISTSHNLRPVVKATVTLTETPTPTPSSSSETQKIAETPSSSPVESPTATATTQTATPSETPILTTTPEPTSTTPETTTPATST